MICEKCKAEATEGAIFCGNCGTKINRPAAPDFGVPEAQSVPVQAASAIPSEVPVMQSAPAQAASAIPSEAPVMQSAPAQAAQPGVLPATQASPAQNIPASLPNAVKPEKPKKKAKALPFILGGAGAAVVGAAAAVIVTCQADVQHIFLGDEKYAASATAQLFSAASDSMALPAVRNTLSSSLTSMTVMTESSMGGANSYISDTGEIITQGDAGFSAAVHTVDKMVGTLTDARGVKAAITYSAELEEDFIDELAKQAGVDAETLKSVIEYCKDTTIYASEKSDENSIQLNGQWAKNGETVFDIAAYCGKDGDTYLSLPFVSENEAFYADLPVSDESSDDLEDGEKIEIDPEKMTELINDLLDDYNSSLSDADIDYESCQESLGNVEFSGKSVTATFDEEALEEMFERFSDTVDNSDYLDELREEYKSGFSASNTAHTVMTHGPDYTDVKLTSVLYMTNSNELRGAKYTVSGKKIDGSKTGVSVQFLKDKNNFAFVLKQNKTKLLEITSETEAQDAGTVSISMASADNYGGNKGKLFTLKIKFSNVKVENIMGRDMMTGSFDFSIKGDGLKSALNGDHVYDDEKFSPYSLVSDATLGIKLSKSGSGIRAVVSLDNRACGSLSYNILIEPNDADVASGDFSDDNIIGLNSQDKDDEAKLRDYRIEYLDAIISRAESDKGFSDMLALSGENAVSVLKEQRDTLIRNRDRYTVYSAYSENSVSVANDFARSFAYRWLDDYGITVYTDKTIKLYYDAKGSLSVIDDAGIEREKLEKYLDGITMQSAYAEIIVNTRRSNYPIGISAVLTDSPDDLPENLPDIYNFIDECYPWENDESNNIGLYVVGTYPYLYSGEPTAKAREEEIVKKVEALDADAKTVYDAVSKYLGTSEVPDDYYKDGSYRVELSVENGVWKENHFSSDLESDIRKYLDRNHIEISDGVVYIRIYDGNIIGVSINEDGYYFDDTADFLLGYTNAWSYIDGYINSCYGTYPKLVSYTGELSDSAVSKLTGTWYSDDGNLTITGDNIRNNFYDFDFGYSDVVMLFLKNADTMMIITYDFSGGYASGNVSTTTYDLYSDGDIIYSSEEYHYYYSRENYNR